jgi:hypothetical protein
MHAFPGGAADRLLSQAGRHAPACPISTIDQGAEAEGRTGWNGPLVGRSGVHRGINTASKALRSLATLFSANTGLLVVFCEAMVTHRLAPE